MMHRTTKIKITELNPHLMCVLCGGYYVDATAIIECLHSFCRTCIVRYLETSKYCPICDVMVHKTKPHMNIRADHTLQDLVYKLVPGLFQTEMQRRREFYKEHPPLEGTIYSPEERGDMTETQRAIYAEDENISLSLEYSTTGMPLNGSDARQEISTKAPADSDQTVPEKRYLLCPAKMSIYHIKKFLRMKFSLEQSHNIVLFKTDEPLSDDYTLMDVAYIYSWRRIGPLRLFYCIYEIPKGGIKRRKADMSTQENDATTTKTQALEGPSKTNNDITTSNDTSDDSCDINKSKEIPINNTTNDKVKFQLPLRLDVVVTADDAKQAVIACSSQLTQTIALPKLMDTAIPKTNGAIMSTTINGQTTSNNTNHSNSEQFPFAPSQWNPSAMSIIDQVQTHTNTGSSNKSLNTITKLNLPKGMNHTLPPQHAIKMNNQTAHIANQQHFPHANQSHCSVTNTFSSARQGGTLT